MKKILYLGTSPAHFGFEGHLVHYPVIKVVPRGLENQEVRGALEDLSAYTHLIFTSKNSVKVFFNLVDPSAVKDKFIVAIGKVTALHIEMCGVNVDLIASEETQEGIIAALKELFARHSLRRFSASLECEALPRPAFFSESENRARQSLALQGARLRSLKELDLKDFYVFLPRSSRSRPELVRFFETQGVRFRAVDLYDTVSQRREPVPDLKTFDEIVFTSPSTVAAFREIFGMLPQGKKLIAIGPITEEALKNCAGQI